MSISTSDILAVLNEKNGNMSLREALWTASALQELTNIGMRDERQSGYNEGYDVGYEAGKRDTEAPTGFELSKLRRIEQLVKDKAAQDVKDVVRRIGSRKKIQCIKELREMHGLGLKETKDIVDNYLAYLDSQNLATWERELLDGSY